VKGATSGNFLRFLSLRADCDCDALLVEAVPTGPVCHTGEATCFGLATARGFLGELQATIAARAADSNNGSYTARLLALGINKVAQKVGEEATEVVTEAVSGSREALLNESANLLYHFLVMLRAKGIELEEMEEVLRNRAKR
jgi:phosphoribosyl-ATP pyrophosphohydrolase/phosphoribosyl-AMP cyclohydrolase